MTTQSIPLYTSDSLPTILERVIEDFDMPIYMYTYDGNLGTMLIISDKEIDDDDLEEVAENLIEEDDDSDEN